MANTYSAFGMKPVQNGIVRKTEYYLPTSNTDAFAIGTPVTLATGSNTNTTINAKTCLAGQYKTIQKATGGDGNALLGAVIGFDTVPTMVFGDYSGYRPSAQERIVEVADHPDQLYEIEVSGITAADIGKNANITIAAPNATTKVDGSYLTATFATTATFQVRIIGIKAEIGNTVGASNTQVVIVQINNYAEAYSSAGV